MWYGGEWRAIVVVVPYVNELVCDWISDENGIEAARVVAVVTRLFVDMVDSGRFQEVEGVWVVASEFLSSSEAVDEESLTSVPVVVHHVENLGRKEEKANSFLIKCLRLKCDNS